MLVCRFCQSASFDTPCGHNEEHNEKAEITQKPHGCFLLSVFFACSYLSSLPRRERENKRGRKEGRPAVNAKAKPVTPAFLSQFGGVQNEGRLVSVFPSCKMKPVQTLTRISVGFVFLGGGGHVTEAYSA